MASSSSAPITDEEFVGDASQNVVGNVKRIAKALLLHQAQISRETGGESKSLDDWMR